MFENLRPGRRKIESSVPLGIGNHRSTYVQNFMNEIVLHVERIYALMLVPSNFFDLFSAKVAKNCNFFLLNEAFLPRITEHGFLIYGVFDAKVSAFSAAAM